MRLIVLRTVIGNRLKVIFSDKPYQEICHISKRSYCEKKVIRELQGGYRKKAHDKSSEASEKGYAILIFPLCTFILGVWQVKRQIWKTDLKNFLNGRYKEEPVALPENSVGQFDVLGMGMYENHPFYSSMDGVDFSEFEYRRIKVRGEFQYEREFLLGPKAGPTPSGEHANRYGMGELKAPGYHIITPFKLEGKNYTIMVNRGFLPEKLLSNEELMEKARLYGPQELTGILRFDQDVRYASYLFMGDLNKTRKFENFTYFMVRHMETMSKYCGSAPIYMECLPKNFGQFTPTITAVAEATLRDDHTMYAFIWFSLTIITALMWYRGYRPGSRNLAIYEIMDKQKNFQRNPRVK